MTDQETPAHRPHNPFDAPEQKGLGCGFTLGISIVLVIHALLGVYLL